jgi:Domain of unknown function (DUF1707)
MVEGIGSGDPGGVRASDADRERTIEVLRESFAQGRLTPEEFHERVDLGYAAKTMAQLAELTTDLPPAGGSLASAKNDPNQVEPQHAAAVQRSFGSEMRRIWTGWASMTIVLSTIWLLTGVSGGFSNYWPIWPVGIYGAVCLSMTLNVFGRGR